MKGEDSFWPNWELPPKGAAKMGSLERFEPDCGGTAGAVERRAPPKGESDGAISEKGDRLAAFIDWIPGAAKAMLPGGPRLLGVAWPEEVDCPDRCTNSQCDESRMMSARPTHILSQSVLEPVRAPLNQVVRTIPGDVTIELVEQVRPRCGGGSHVDGRVGFVGKRAAGGAQR